ncbi:MAG: hypothetical protein ABSF14_05215 [Terriglobia bacterium]
MAKKPKKTTKKISVKDLDTKKNPKGGAETVHLYSRYQPKS